MNRKIISTLLSFALLISCITVMPFSASADMTYYVHENFENVADLQELEERPEIFQVHGGSNGSVGIANIPERGNVVEFNFSSKPSDGTNRNNFIKFNPNPGISLGNNRVIMEAKVYPTVTGNHAIRLFEHTWSSHAYTNNPNFEPLVILQNGNIEGASGAMTAYSVNEWYHIFIVVNSTDNPSERTYDVYANGELIGSSLQRAGTFTTATSSVIEYINIASELLTQRALIKNITQQRICSFGIPIQKKFATKTECCRAREALDIPQNKRTILVMAGSMGYGDMPEIISGILNYDKSFTVLAVCGNNKKLLKKLESKGYGDNVRLFGFTDQISLLMDAADCIVTKPGGLSTSEAMSKKLPMVLVNPIPGQEDRNLEFFLNNGVALAVTKTFTIEEALHFLFCNNSIRLEQIKRQLELLAKPNASADLAEFVLNLKHK